MRTGAKSTAWDKWTSSSFSNLNSWLLLLIPFLGGMVFALTYIERTPRLISIPKHSTLSELTSTKRLGSNRPSSFDQCGTWQERYIARHQAILNGSLPPRYLVSVATETGLGDRMFGTLSEFFFALLSDRAFQIITYGTLPAFEAAFTAPYINWSRPTDPNKLIDNLKITYRGQRNYHGDRSYGADVDTKQYWPLFLVNDDDNSNGFYHTSNVSRYPTDHDNVTTLFVASNRGRIVRLFDNPYHRNQLLRMGLRPETAAKCAFDFLFAPTDAVRKSMAKEFQALRSIDVLKIGINIRVGDDVFDPKNDEKTNFQLFEPYFKCAADVESFARLPNQSVLWYVTSDSLVIRQTAKKRYGDKVLTEDTLHYFHGDCGDTPAKRFGDCTKTAQDASIVMAAGQMLAIGMCDYNVIALMSGFGQISALLSGNWHNVYQVYFKNRACSINDYESFQHLSTAGAGL